MSLATRTCIYAPEIAMLVWRERGCVEWNISESIVGTIMRGRKERGENRGAERGRRRGVLD